MRLVRATLTNYRGIESSTIEFGDGVTIVEGPNEIGKSSIAEAINLLRTAKSSSNTQQIRSIRPVGKDVDPEAELELHTGSYHLTFRKKWARNRGETTLTIHSPRQEQVSGDEAHQRYNDILTETIDTDLLTALEVLQGDSLDQAKLATIPALQRALGDGEGVTESTDALMERVDEEFARYFTPRAGKPVGDYDKLRNRRDELSATITHLEAESREMDQLVQEHEAALRRQAQLDGQIQENAKELAEASEAREALRDLREAVGKASNHQALAKRAVEDIQQGVARRRQRVAEVSELAHQVTELDGKLESLRLKQRDTAAARDEAKQLHEQADSTRRATARELSSARQALEALDAFTAHAALQDRLSKAEEAESAKRAAEKTLAKESLTQQTLKKLHKLDTAFRVAQQAMDATAPRVTVQRLGDDAVEIDGAPLVDTSSTFAIRDSLHVHVPGVVSVEVESGQGDTTMNASLQAAQQALSAALSEAGVESLEEAEEAVARREKAERDIDRATTTLADRLDGTTIQELRDDVAELLEKTTDVDASVSREDARAEVRRLETLHAEQESAADDAAAEAERTRARAETADKELLEATVTIESLQRQLTQASERLASEREEADDDVLARMSEEAEAGLESAVHELEEAKSALDAAQPDLVELRFTNAQELAASHQQARQEQREIVVKLRTLLDGKVDAGIYEKLTEARAAHEAVSETWERLDRSARAVKLLRETLTRHRDEAQQQYVAPFTERITKLGQVVFGPDFEVQVTPDLTIESRTLDGRTVAFQYLSAGAREQLSLIGRLACAQLIDEHEGVPILLDDALGFADPERLKRLNYVLNQVGRTAQVIVLTCQPERFDRVGGASRQTLRRS